MKRRCIWSLLAFALFCFGGATNSFAQDEDDDMTFDPVDPSAEPAPEEFDPVDPSEEPELPEPEPELPEPGEAGEPLTADDAPLGRSRVSWQDIVVVVRKPFLKVGRAELVPLWGTTMNDNLIRHYMFGGQLNYWLTDVLATGIEGFYYVDDLREPFDLVARQARRLPTVNKYNYSAALNFHYVPIYGKFAVLNEHIITWESYFTLGVGITQSEVLPRDPALQSFTNMLITPNVGASMRFFLTKVPHGQLRRPRLRVHRSIRGYRSHRNFRRRRQGQCQHGPHQQCDVPGRDQFLVPDLLRIHHVPLATGTAHSGNSHRRARS